MIDRPVAIPSPASRNFNSSIVMSGVSAARARINA
jgi:hypothetical protein